MLKKIPTDKLIDTLKNTENVQEYIKTNVNNQTLSEKLFDLLKDKNISKSEVIKSAEINEIYGYQIFSGNRIPSRDKLLCICFGLSLTLEEIQDLLKCTGYAPLYPRLKRDSIIIFCINKKCSVVETNQKLFDNEEPLLN